MAFFQFGKEAVENFSGGFSALMDVVKTVVDDFGLNDGDEAGGLAFFGIFGEASAIFDNSVVSGGERVAVVVEVDFESGAPFGETQTHLVVFGEASVETNEAFGVSFGVIWGFRVGSFDGGEALVDLDARDETFAGEIVDEILAIVGELASSFVKEDDAVDVFFEIFGGEKEVAVIAAVLVSIRDI